ncbi:hypothetical protein SEA_BAXTERFOX_78 [Gordonia phage BaxterFox]|uniref:Uncharacterized protein n=1 Tax=Gordonia phage BaxterFox TaxID=1821549 RepID=A0A142KCQ5_9CAUD|nr:hypothetical protein SEA_BAXTERFOX_78 [Gordonia phage BaxterFox]AMS03888.1 hypothetical protein SEA_BAXTERFOX_78 [Gordonia phage BaxterFox]
MTRHQPIDLDPTPLADFQIWHDLTWRNQGFITIDGLLDSAAKSSREYLIEKGYEISDIDRVAIRFDHDRYLSRYFEHFVLPEERSPELPVRDHLIDVCGYPADVVDAFIEKRATEDRERARKRAEREAYERTWRYRARAVIREARDRTSTAWAVLRGQHDCDCEGEW